ncbi:MAG: carboxypeptidase-like regulatory domain-containing protein [Chitinophagales bacterium]
MSNISTLSLFQKIGLCLFFCFLQTPHLQAQSLLDKSCSIELKGATIVEALQQLSKQTNTNIAFSKRFFSTEKRLSFEVENESFQAVLKRILAGTKVGFKAQGKQVILFRERKKVIEKYTIHGYLKDEDLGEDLVAATVYCPKLQKGTISNEYGYYSLNLPKGEHTLVYRYVGKKDIQKQVVLKKNQKVDVDLPSQDYLSEILVTPDSNSDLQLANLVFREGQIQNLAVNTPGLGGEPDLMQTVRSLAGVQSGAGGIGGYYVRGGSNGQNLILMDGVPVYNAAHQLGIYSIFNPKAARSVQVHKGGFSAKYAGRLSSVIDIQTREGNMNKWSTEIGVNPQSVQLTTEGPIFGKTGSFLLAARHSTFGGFIRPIIEDTFYPNGANFLSTKYFDVNLKVNKKLGERDRLYGSVYIGGDKIVGYNEWEYYYEDEFGFEYDELETEDNELNWGNAIGSIRWNHQFSPKLFANTSLIYSRYFNDYNQLFQYYDLYFLDEEPYDFSYYWVSSSNKEYTFKTDLDFYPNQAHHIRVGASFRQHEFSPFMTLYDNNTEGLPETDSLSIDYFEETVEVPIIQAKQVDTYIEDKWTLSQKWQLTLGLHQSAFLGEYENYFNLEPRFKSDFAITPKLTFSTGVSRMVQYLHLISTSEFNIPTDFWLPSDDFYEPQTAWQYDAGFYIGLPNKIHLSLNGYYKNMKNITAVSELNFEEESDGTIGGDDFLTGDGESYGFEASLHKNEGKLQCSLGYSLSWSNRQFDPVNLGQKYPFQFDRRHELKGLFTYEFNKRFLLGFQGYLGAGHPRLVSWINSFDQGLLAIDIDPIGEKNSTRDTWQHRLDLSLMYHWETKKLKHQLKVSAYNVYNKRNPLFYYLENDEINPINPDLQSNFSMSFIPSFHYSLAF